MTFFQENRWQPSWTLPAEEITYFRSVLKTHANDPTTGRCAVCRAVTCSHWSNAYDQLAMAGELMAEPEPRTE